MTNKKLKNSPLSKLPSDPQKCRKLDRTFASEKKKTVRPRFTKKVASLPPAKENAAVTHAEGAFGSARAQTPHPEWEKRGEWSGSAEPTARDATLEPRDSKLAPSHAGARLWW